MTNFPFPHLGGVSRCISDELNFFSNKAYNLFLIYSPSDTPFNTKFKNNVTILPQKPSPKKPITIVNRIRRSFLIRKITLRNNVQCIYAHDIYSALICVFALLGKRTILHLHSVFSEDLFKMGKPFPEQSVKEKIITLLSYCFHSTIEFMVYNLVHSIMCVSGYQLENAKQKTLSKKKVFLLPNGIDINIFKPNPNNKFALKREFDIDQDVIVCMFLGRMVHKNGPLLIVKAVPLVNQRISKIFFIFVGDGIEKNKIEKYVKKEKLENVILLDGTPAEKILPLADIFITNVSPVWSNTLDRTILEAMASEIPTIVGKDEHKKSLFKDGKELIFVKKGDPKDIADKIISLISNSEKRRILGINGRKKVVEKYSLEKFMERLELIAKNMK